MIQVDHELLSGKTAVIAGGVAGMGRATALTFSREGTHVRIIDNQETAGLETVELIGQAGARPCCSQ